MSDKLLNNFELLESSVIWSGSFSDQNLNSPQEIPQEIVIKQIVFDLQGTLVESNGERGQIELIENILNLLNFLQNKNIALFLWTSHCHATCDKILTKMNLKNFFTDISNSSIHQVKPSPDGLTAMIGQNRSESTLVIGDSPSDMQGAHNFKAHKILCQWERRMKKQSQQAPNAPREVSTYIDFLGEKIRVYHDPLDLLKDLR